MTQSTTLQAASLRRGPDFGCNYMTVFMHKFLVGVAFAALLASASVLATGKVYDAPLPAQLSSDPDLCAYAPRSEEHTSELQSLMRISYAVFCLKKTKKQQ